MSWSPREFRKLWPEFDAPSWRAWASVEDAIFGLEPEDPELVMQVTGREELPTEQVSEVWAPVGRGAGKSRWVSRLAVYFAAGRAYRRAPGEQVYVGIFAPDRRQARITQRYVSGLLHAVPVLEREVERELRESIELRSGVTIEVITASKAAPRGRSYALAIVEEAAFLRSEDSAEPDVELLRALRPALARVPGSLLAVVSSPYARRGELWRVWQRYYGKPSDRVLVVQADTATMNPTFAASEIDRAYDEDPVSAAAEYGAQFRSDVETFIQVEAVEAVTVPGRLEVPPSPAWRYFAFLDFAGGSGADSATLAVAHAEDRGESPAAVLDAVREVRPPFSPERVCADFARVLASYSLSEATADRWAAGFATEAMARHGVTLRPSEQPKGDLYRELLPRLNSGAVELLDVPRLRAQLVGLERRVSRGGRDSIDHAPGGHDDLANAAAGALVGAGASTGRQVWGSMLRW